MDTEKTDSIAMVVTPEMWAKIKPATELPTSVEAWEAHEKAHELWDTAFKVLSSVILRKAVTKDSGFSLTLSIK